MNRTERLLDTGWSDAPGLRYYWGAIRRQIWILILVPLLGGFLGFTFAVVSEPLYTASADLRVEVEGEMISELVSPFNTHIELIRSDQITREVIDKLNLDEAFAGTPSRLRKLVTSIRHQLGLEQSDEATADGSVMTVRNVESGLGVDRLSNTSLIEVSYTSPSRNQAAAIANAYAEAYLGYTNARETQRLDRRVERLERRAADVEAQAELASREAQEIIARNGFVVADSEDLRGRVAELREQLSEINLEEAVLREQLVNFDGLRGDEKLRSASFISDGNTETYFELRRAEERLMGLRDRPDVPPETISELEDAIATMRDTLDQAFDRSRQELRAEQAALQARRSSIEDALDDLQGYGQRPEWSNFLVTEREAATYEDLYQSYLTQIEDLYRQGADTPVYLVSDAVSPVAPSFPDYKVVLAVSIALGLATAVCLALLREWLSRPVVTGRLRDA